MAIFDENGSGPARCKGYEAASEEGLGERAKGISLEPTTNRKTNPIRSIDSGARRPSVVHHSAPGVWRRHFTAEQSARS